MSVYDAAMQYAARYAEWKQACRDHAAVMNETNGQCVTQQEGMRQWSDDSKRCSRDYYLRECAACDKTRAAWRVKSAAARRRGHAHAQLTMACAKERAR
jgi:hypothetical protein